MIPSLRELATVFRQTLRTSAHPTTYAVLDIFQKYQAQREQDAQGPNIIGEKEWEAQNATCILEKVSEIQKNTHYQQGCASWHFSSDSSLSEQAKRDPLNGEVKNQVNSAGEGLHVATPNICSSFTVEGCSDEKVQEARAYLIATMGSLKITHTHQTYTASITSPKFHVLAIHSINPDGVNFKPPTRRETLKKVCEKILESQ